MITFCVIVEPYKIFFGMQQIMWMQRLVIIYPLCKKYIYKAYEKLTYCKTK